MKKFILFFFALVASVCAFAQGTADFNTLEPSSSYKTYTTTDGWVIENGCVQGGASDPENASNPHFPLFGENDGAVAAVINGKTTAVGKITSPILEGGCGTLSLNYAYMFAESNGVSFHVAILQNGAAVAEYDVVDKDLQQKTAGSWSQKVAVPGAFQIVITNNCPSQSTSNKDRWSIWNLSWTAQAPLPVNPVVATITAVFPNGNKHAVYSNGTKLTAGAEVPADAIAQFDVVSRTENTIVLKAGDQYLHWTSGDNTSKSADLDGLNEEFDETLNVLHLSPADFAGAITATKNDWGQSQETVAGLYQIKGYGTNGQLFDFTLRENDDAWIAGDSGNYFFDTNWDGNGCRTSFFEIVVEEVNAEVDFEKVNVAAIKQADFVEEGKWYLLKQKRGPSNTVLVTPVHDEGVGAPMKRAATDVIVEGSDAAEAVDYLLRFIPTENEGAYNLQFANGHYWASTMTTTEEEPGEYNVYNINGEATHIGINLFDMGSIVDNNGAGNTLAFWASGEVTSLNGNNDWTVWEVEFAPKTTAAADLKALISEVEAAYNANNVVVEVGEGIITSTDQFSSEYTDEEEGSLANLLDGDGSTFWHSTWHHGNNTPMHVHYLQVEFAEPISGDFELNMNRRVNNGGMCQNDNPVKMSVETSVDGVEFVLADEFDTPFTQTGAAPLVQAVFNIPTAAKYLRFFADECNGGSNRGYWHCGDFQIKPVVTPAPNAAHAEAAAAFAEALAAAKAVGANATDADVAALQAAYDAYVAALTAAPADQYVLNFDKALEQKSDDRHVTGFKLNDQQVTFPAYTTVYLDATDKVMEVTAGEELKPAIIWDGQWMHGLVYVDLGNDGSFYEEGDLVAHSPYTGSQNLATTISAFNAPEKEGVYRLRIKTDWVGDSQHMDGGGLDPAGRIGDDGTMEGNNSIWANRGHIVDIMLKVVKADEPKPFPAPGVAYKIKNVDAKLYLNVIDNVAAGTNNGTILGAQPMKLYFEAVEGGYYIKNEAGLYVGGHTNTWSMSSAVPEVWTIEEAENGTYKLHSATGGNAGYLGFDSTAAGSSAFRDKGADKHWLHTILEFDAVEPLTFEFAKNEDGTITVAPSDDNRVYFYDIYSEAIRNKYYDGMNTVDCAKYAVAHWLNAPDLETHKGVSTVDPKAWLTYFLGYAIVPGDYQIVAVAVDGAGDNWTVAGDVAVYDFSYAVKTKAELWEQYLAVLDKMKQAVIANKLDPENLKNINSPVAGKPGYKPVKEVHNLAIMYKTYSTDVWNAGSYENYPYDIEEDLEACQGWLDEYNAAPICLPEAGKTYIIYSDPYSYGKANYSYVLGNCVPQTQGYNGPSTIKYGDGSAITNAFVWTCEGPVAFERENEFFEKETVDIRYKFTNVENGTYLNWKGQDMWYLSGENTPYYGSLKMQVNADNNLYRWLVIDMRDGSLNQANGDCTGNTYSNWFYFEEFEPIVTNWDGAEPIVEVKDATTVKVTFADAHSVEATNFGVLAAIYDEQGDVYGVVFNDLFGDTVEFGKDCAVLRFKKITEINAELAEAAKGAAAKITAAAPGVDVAGKVVIASKSFKIDGESIYNDVIVKDFEFLGGTVTGIDGIAIDANAKVYDLQGRRVAAPRQGLQISNGVKVVR